MKHSRTVALVLSTLLLSVSGLTQAQSLKPPVESSRMAAFMDRDVFLSMHRWDEMTGMWVVKSSIELPKGIMPRAEVMAMVDKFLVMNKWDAQHEQWVSGGTPRDMSKLTREEVRVETIRFLMTHQWDESAGTWVSKMRVPTKN